MSIPTSEKTKEIAIRPPSPGTQQSGAGQYRPDQLDPDLANIAMAKHLVDAMGSPTILNKPFVVRYGIFNALNHTHLNRTGYDSTIRLAVYREVAKQSVNIDGRYFLSLWAFLMKPKYIIQGMPGQTQFQEEQKEGIFSRIGNWLRGGNKSGQPDHT